jgi:DNA transposition AAA+ family ATPase
MKGVNASGKSATMTELQQVMKERRYTQSAVARAIGYSDSSVSQWLAGKYKGDVAALEHAVRGFLERDSEKVRNRRIKLKFVETTTSARVFDACRMCHLDGEIGVVHGDAGAGKTTSIKEYAKRNSDVILIEADRSYTTSDLFREIHKKCGFDGEGNLNKMKDDIIDRLEDSGRLIIIDEPESLSVRALDLLRRINDKAHVGILFCGLERFMENLRLRQTDFAYLYTRVSFKIALDSLLPEDVEAIVNEVLQEGDGLWQAFWNECHGNGRVLEKLVGRSLRLAELNGVPVSSEIVREAAKMLVI